MFYRKRKEGLALKYLSLRCYTFVQNTDTQNKNLLMLAFQHADLTVSTKCKILNVKLKPMCATNKMNPY